ncbi:MAG: ferredoxin--NADP reductase [Bacteroidia bacterium]
MRVQLLSFFDESPRVRRFRWRYTAEGEAFYQQVEQFRAYAGISSEEPIFQPGQFVQLRHEAIFPEGRSYSLCHWLEAAQPEFELCIVLNEKGKATPWLFEQEVGLELECTPPQGRFVLENDPEGMPLVFIATGTGLAPLMPMMETALKQGGHSVYLFAGHRWAEDELFQKELQHWQNQYPAFTYFACGSREPIQGRQCYVHACYEPFLKKWPQARFYACGWKAMLSDCRSILKSAGYSRRDYRMEAYD